MEIVIFSDNKAIDKLFSKIKKSKDYDLEYLPVSDFKKALKNPGKRTILYLDVANYSAAELSKTLKVLSKQDGLLYGIIDQKGVIKDPGELFHEGASDYIGKGIPQGGITPKRLNSVSFFKGDAAKEEDKDDLAARIKDYIISGNDWSEVRSGKEYTFTLMLVELDNQPKIKSQLGPNNSKDAANLFREYLEQTVAPLNGRIWMWKDFGGLILFPFNGQNCPSIIACFKLMLTNIIFSVEYMDYDWIFSYKIALHIGNTVYRAKGDTGKIISDSINSIFHLGQKYTEPRSLYITQDAFNFAPEKLKKCFVPAGKFEGRDIMRMKRPV